MGILINLVGKMLGRGETEGSRGTEEKKPEDLDLPTFLDQRVNGQAGNLHWRHSVVDLLQLVGGDPAYPARKKLAFELGYSQETLDQDGAEEMNRWLHGRVLELLEENGGEFPNR